jgi:hypothetical protein
MNRVTGRLPYWGIAWYRKHFRLPAPAAGRRISLELDGAMAYAAVWCNDQFGGGYRNVWLVKTAPIHVEEPRPLEPELGLICRYDFAF